jgi:hypothetical protein
MLLMNLRETVSAARKKVFDVRPLELPDVTIIRIKDAYASSERRKGSTTDQAHADHYELMSLRKVHTRAEVLLFSRSIFMIDTVVDISPRRTEDF